MGARMGATLRQESFVRSGLENWKRRDRNTETKRQRRARGEAQAKAGYVKNKGQPPSEIEFWQKHGSHDLRAVRAARAEYQKRDFENYRRTTAMCLKDVAYQA